ncbi:MAG: hypothetical protein ABR526_04665 [Chthoniobacterales bacterium]
MSEPTTPADLLDLKMMPAWVNEPAEATDYSKFEGEDENSFRRERRPPQRGRGGDGEQRPRGPRPQGRRDDRKRPDQQRRPEGRDERPPQRPERREAPMPLPQVDVRFLPHAGAFESVIAQMKSGAVAYSVFALARMFLDKAERYSVHLKPAAGAELHQLGEHGPVAVDPRILEGGAFAAMRDEFYTSEQTQTEEIKGNFSNVARDRASGTLLGPTNHHSYQPQLRNLYEQRYSRRMSFQDFQRQIEIVSDPAVVEQWKEQARSVTTYTAKETEPPVTFNSLAEVERHFRQTHLPTLLRSAPELTISGVVSRQLPDRLLGRVIEEAWAAEIRSPSRMMQELASGLRQAGLNIFRHRRGMLFVSPIRTRPFGHERAGVSASINSILQKVTDAPGINRKQLAEQLTTPGAEPADAERAKRTLIADLRWLVSEGYLIEFNDGTLDLPRAKAPAPATAAPQVPVTAAAPAAADEQVQDQQTTAAQPEQVAATPSESEVELQANVANGGEGSMSVEQTPELQPAKQEAAAGSSAPPENPPAKTEEQSSITPEQTEVPSPS